MVMKEKKLRDLFLLIVLLCLVTYTKSHAEEAPKPAEPPPAPRAVERSYPEDFETVWNKLEEVLKEKGLFEHLHGKAIVDKENGTIKTPTFRYFKIWSAKSPVVERDYRDTYTITVTKAQEGGKEAKVKVQRKFEIFDSNAKPAPGWVDADPANEPVKVGISSEDLLNALQTQLASAVPTTPTPAPTPAAPASAAPTAPVPATPAPTAPAPPSAAPTAPKQ